MDPSVLIVPPNPAVKRTHTGGAHLYAHRASRGPVRAPQLYVKCLNSKEKLYE